jgi:hypothetical protein
MVVLPKKEWPKELNSAGLKRGDIVQMEVADSTPEYISVDPSTLKLHQVRNPVENREPIMKPKKQNAANMPLPALKNMLPNAPMPAPTGNPQAAPLMPPAGAPVVH